MPWNRNLYPKNWEQIALEIKQSASWKCEECGKQCRRPEQSFDDFAIGLIEQGYYLDLDHPQKYTLTVAHLNHCPEDCSPENLRALCAPCHCRYDLKAMGTKQHLHRERHGQLSLEV